MYAGDSSSFVRWFGLVSDDVRLVQALEGAVATNGVLTVATEPGEIETIVARRDLRALIVDGQSMGADLVRRLVGSDSLLLVERDALRDEPTFHLFSRDDTPLLIHRIQRLSRGTDSTEGLLGTSTSMSAVRARISRVAHFADVSVLVRGDTGTGKELVANAIHQATHGDEQPFVAINCAAIPEALLESELFGHEAGAFTGARGMRRGLFEEAQRGTVFLDEIGEMPPQMQPKLLRVLETKTFRRVGSNAAIPLEARIVSATNRSNVSHAGLRLDLFYRLASTQIVLPPLRERRDDIALLATHFLDAFRSRYRKAPIAFASSALEALRDHAWPGNVRELRAVVEQAAIAATSRTISREELGALLDLGSAVHGSGESSRPPKAPASPVPPGLRDVEREIVLDALRRNGGNVSRTANELQIPRSTLRGMLQRLGALARERPSQPE